MKFLSIIMMICGVISLSHASVSQKDLKPELVKVNFHTNYIPQGFDTNDHVQMVAEGTFNDACYRPAKPEIKVDHKAKTIQITPRAYRYNSFGCALVLVDYHQVIDLNLLEVGKYKVLQHGNKSTFGDLSIRAATNSDPDDFLYAPVSQAYLSQNGNGSGTLQIDGVFTDNCTELVDVAVDIQPKVIVVRPIAEREDRKDCKKGSFPFATKVDVNGLNKGKYLLHVRSLNAKAINNLIEIE